MVSSLVFADHRIFRVVLAGDIIDWLALLRQLSGRIRTYRESVLCCGAS